MKLFQARFHRSISLLGEEPALRARLTTDLPSWFHFPDVERAHWLNSIVTALWPHVAAYADRVLRLTVEPAARDALEAYNLRGFRFRQIELGRIPPRISGIKVKKIKIARHQNYGLTFSGL